MIRRLVGKVVEISGNYIVLDVESVGYKIYTSENPKGFRIGDDLSLYTHLAVRENALDLYGFQTNEELDIFELLLSLPKIGPKSASQILRQADIKLLKEAVRNEDPAYLSKLSGIGKKSAEKIVAGLKEKFEAQGLDDIAELSSDRLTNNHISDTVDALIALGYPQSEARRVVITITSDNPSISDSKDALRLALKLLGQ